MSASHDVDDQQGESSKRCYMKPSSGLTHDDEGAVISEDTSAKHPLSLTHKANNTDLKIELRLYSCNDNEPAERRSTGSKSLM
jgi:hypothetical protein